MHEAGPEFEAVNPAHLPARPLIWEAPVSCVRSGDGRDRVAHVNGAHQLCDQMLENLPRLGGKEWFEQSELDPSHGCRKCAESVLSYSLVVSIRFFLSIRIASFHICDDCRGMPAWCERGKPEDVCEYAWAVGARVAPCRRAQHFMIGAACSCLFAGEWVPWESDDSIQGTLSEGAEYGKKRHRPVSTGCADTSGRY
jgi:hypothetical protein